MISEAGFVCLKDDRLMRPLIVDEKRIAIAPQLTSYVFIKRVLGIPTYGCALMLAKAVYGGDCVGYVALHLKSSVARRTANRPEIGGLRERLATILGTCLPPKGVLSKESSRCGLAFGLAFVS